MKDFYLKFNNLIPSREHHVCIVRRPDRHHLPQFCKYRGGVGIIQGVKQAKPRGIWTSTICKRRGLLDWVDIALTDECLYFIDPLPNTEFYAIRLKPKPNVLELTRLEDIYHNSLKYFDEDRKAIDWTRVHKDGFNGLRVEKYINPYLIAAKMDFAASRDGENSPFQWYRELGCAIEDVVKLDVTNLVEEYKKYGTDPVYDFGLYSSEYMMKIRYL